MNDQNNRQGKRVASSQRGPARKGYWHRYKAWLAGLDRGERIRHRVLQTATILSLIIIAAYLILSAWIRMPSLPGANHDPSGAGDLSDLSFDGAEAPDIAKSGRKDGVYTILLVGKDVASGSTDTMLLLSYDTKEKTLRGMNLPRDTMINVSTTSKRLNAVYAYNKGKDKATQVKKGMTALKKEVANITGIAPDFYALVEWEAIGELVEALGGVEFEVPFDMDYDDPYQDLHIHQKAGLRLLNGDDAMQVIRHRKNNDGSHSNGDVGRLKIQQEFLKAVAKKCLQPATFLKIPALAEIFTKNVTTDLTVGNIIAFAQAAYGMDPDEDVSFVTAPLADSFLYRGASLVTLDPDGILEIVNNGMNPYQRDIEASDLHVVYRNSSGSFGVTNGVLADSKMGQASSSSSSKPSSKPVEEEPDLPDEPLEPDEPDLPDSSQAEPGGSTSQGGDTSQGAGGSSSSSGGQQPPASGDGSQGAGSQGGSGDPSSEPSQDVPPAESSSIIPPIDPSQVLPDPNAGAADQAA